MGLEIKNGSLAGRLAANPVSIDFKFQIKLADLSSSDGHCHLKGHLFKLGLRGDPTCDRCLQEDESATHILCQACPTSNRL
jgi:hypothetical protein